MKQNIKVIVDNTRSSKQDSKEMKGSVRRIDRHMEHFNAAMIKLTNFIKVLFRFLLIIYIFIY